MSTSKLLKDAYDVHVHASPDVIPRTVDLAQLYFEAEKAGMAGILIKDHCTSTVGRAAALNQLGRGNCRFFSALALNPPDYLHQPTKAFDALETRLSVAYNTGE